MPPEVLDNLFGTTQCRRPLIFQTINSIRSNSLGLKYQRFTTTRLQRYRDWKIKFVATTQFLYPELLEIKNSFVLVAIYDSMREVMIERKRRFQSYVQFTLV